MRWKGLSVAAMLAVASCTPLRPATDRPDTSGVDVRSDATADVQGDGSNCVDPTGFNGRGCFNCPPTSRAEFLNACTSATCLPFDNARLPLSDGGLPSVPPLMDAAVDAAPNDVPSMPTDSGMPTDAGPTLPRCSTLSGGNVVYATGSSAVTLFLGQIAQALENAASPVAIVYRSNASCAGVNALVNPASNRLTGTATYWDPNPGVDPTSAAAQLSCQLDDAGVLVDLGFSDVFASTCLDLPSGLDPSLRDFLGPIQVMNFVVPQNSMQRSISAEAAYLVWGFGGAMFPVEPWTNVSLLQQRNPTSGTQALIAATIGVPRDRWRGRTNAGSGNVRDALFAAGMAGTDSANRALGILSSDFADGLRDRLRILAYQHYGQSCGFWPDSSESARDKRNVRDGHYPMFGPLHQIARVDTATRMALNPNVQRVVNVINGVETLPSVNIVDIYARRGLIPQCAMRVTRSADGGDITTFTPERSCGCYFEERASGLSPPPGCVACDRPEQCTNRATPNCVRFAGQTSGYCEP